MIVEEDVVYRATIRLHGERVERLRVVKERVPFVVDEHQASSIVPVCRWNAPARGSVVEGDVATRVSEVVGVDGGFFTQAGGRPGDPEALRRMLDGFGVFKREFFDEFSLQAGAYRPAEVVDLSRAAVASIEPYDRRRWVGALERKVAGFALLDGRLHRRESEPVLVAGTNGSGLPGKAHMERIGRSVGTPTVVPAWSADVADGSKGRGVFRLDRLDDAVAFAAAYAGRPVDEVKVSGSFELLDRTSLRLDDEVFALAAAARQAVRHLGGDLTWLPRPAVDAAFDLRDMLAEPELRLDLLVDASERMLENLRPIAGDQNSERDKLCIRDVIEQMDEAVERIAASRPAVESAPGVRKTMKHQILEVPFAYNLKGMRKGQRKDREYIRETSISVKIPCPTEVEAPVALVCHRRGRWGDAVKHPPRDYRFHDGKLYRPIDVETRYDEPDRQVSVDGLVGAVSERQEGADNPLHFGALRTWWDYDQKVKGAAELGDALIVSTSEEEEVAALIRRKAEELIFVDGKVYRETSEPMYVVTSGHFEHRIGAEIHHLEGIKEPKDVAKHFRADQLPEVLEAIASRFRRELDFDAERPATFREYVPDWIEVREGFEHVLTYRHDQTPQFLAAVERAVAAVGKDLADQPIPVLLAYGEMRDAYRAEAPARTIADLAGKLCDVLKNDSWDARHLREELGKYRIAPVADVPAVIAPKA